MSVQTFEYKAFTAPMAWVLAGLPRRQPSRKRSATPARGLTPVTLSEARSHRTRGVRIASKELAHFTYQLGVLLNAKVQLAEGLLSIAEQEREGPLRSVVEDVARRVTAGESVSSALEAHAETFGGCFRGIRSGLGENGHIGGDSRSPSRHARASQEATRRFEVRCCTPLRCRRCWRLPAS